MTQECPRCGDEYANEHGVRIHHTKSHGEPLPNCECNVCGSSFYHPESDRKRCEDHQGQGGELNGNYKDAIEEGECLRCGDIFEYYLSDKDGKYCPDCAEERVWTSDGVKYQYEKPIGPEPYDPNHDVEVVTRTDGYEMIDRQYDGERVAIPHHRLVAIAWYGFEAVVGKDIHHKNEIKWDNREDNLEPLTKKDHAKLHSG